MASIDLNTSLPTINLGNQISVAVAKKGLDAQKQQGEAAIQLLQAAAATASSNPLPGGTMDIQA